MLLCRTNPTARDHLRTLVLSGCIISDQGTECIVQYCPKLKRLSINDGIGLNSIEFLVGLPLRLSPSTTTTTPSTLKKSVHQQQVQQMSKNLETQTIKAAVGDDDGGEDRHYKQRELESKNQTQLCRDDGLIVGAAMRFAGGSKEEDIVLGADIQFGQLHYEHSTCTATAATSSSAPSSEATNKQKCKKSWRKTKESGAEEDLAKPSTKMEENEKNAESPATKKLFKKQKAAFRLTQSLGTGWDDTTATSDSLSSTTTTKKKNRHSTAHLSQYFAHFRDSLTELSLRNCTSTCFGDTIKYLYLLRNLQQLDLSGCTAISEDALCFLFSQPATKAGKSHLLASYSKRNNEEKDAVITDAERATFPQMRALRLDGCVRAVTDKSISVIAASCALSLERLSLLACSLISDVGVSALAKHCKQLHSLAMSHCSAVQTSIPTLLLQCTALTSLRLDGCTQLTFEQLSKQLSTAESSSSPSSRQQSSTHTHHHGTRALFKLSKLGNSRTNAAYFNQQHYLSLEKLSLRDAFYISDSSFLVFIALVQNLRKLELGDCGGIPTDRVLFQLIQKSDDGRYLNTTMSKLTHIHISFNPAFNRDYLLNNPYFSGRHSQQPNNNNRPKGREGEKKSGVSSSNLRPLTDTLRNNEINVVERASSYPMMNSNCDETTTVDLSETIQQPSPLRGNSEAWPYLENNNYLLTDRGMKHLIQSCVVPTDHDMPSSCRFSSTSASSRLPSSSFFKRCSWGQTRLRSIRLDNCCMITDVTLQAIAKHCSLSLRELRITKNKKVSDRGMLLLFSRCQELKRVTISECYALTDNSLCFVANFCEALVELDCSFNNRFTNDGFSLLGRKCFRLRELKMDGCWGLTEGVLPHIAAIPALTSLSLRSCGQLSTLSRKQVLAHWNDRQQQAQLATLHLILL